VGVEEEQFLLRQARQPPIEGGAIGDDLAGAFLERDKDSGRALPACGVDEALQGEDGFARARAADEQARAVARQPAAAQLVESLDAGGQLGQGLSRFAFRRDCGSPSVVRYAKPRIGICMSASGHGGLYVRDRTENCVRSD